ncbi:MAG TPA: F0F1 ATP synthase subunit epsilon [Acidobacteriota bacterium]|nr:F0F1 ATP synthase subunit epsilon [Acidobacteriota bacterium]
MKLKILLPTEVFLEEEVIKISSEALNGSFTILPRHLDFVTVLQPGLLYFETNKKETFLAVDKGVLLKVGAEVLVSVRSAVRAEGLKDVRKKVEKRYQELNEREKRSRSVLAKFESDFIRRFIELEKNV